MALKIASSLSRISSSPLQSTTTLQVKLPPGLHFCSQLSIQHLKSSREAVNSFRFQSGKLKMKELSPNTRFKLFASIDDLISDSAIESNGTKLGEEDDDDDLLFEDEVSRKCEIMEINGGRPGFISFYNRPYERESEIIVLIPTRKQSDLLFFVGPAVLVASFIFPSLYMRRILSAIFEDSLLTDFLILFFTEALFYCGVAAFLLIVDHLRRPIEPIDAKISMKTGPQLAYRLTSAAILVLSLVIPMATMGLVWPWTGPAASATLAPYLVGIVLQFSFEQYAKYVNSPSWPVIPVIFQVYRLHQLNRAAQLVTALSMTVRGAEMTPHNLAINGSLCTLLNVLQLLGIICIWSLSTFLMRFFPSTNDS